MPLVALLLASGLLQRFSVGVTKLGESRQGGTGVLRGIAEGNSSQDPLSSSKSLIKVP